MGLIGRRRHARDPEDDGFEGGGGVSPRRVSPEVKPTGRGWPVRAGGSAFYIAPVPEFHSTTVQVCGLWPFSIGSGTPMIGVPIGKEMFTGACVCCDPISWFSRAGLIGNPSVFVQGKPGLGKSSLVCRMCLGLASYGVNPIVLGDLKPDYRDLVVALGGRVVSLGRGQGTLNVLDPGAAASAAQRLPLTARRQLLADAEGRRLTMLSALLEINRRRNVDDQDHEEAILVAALAVLDEHHAPGDATLPDLVQVLDDAPQSVHDVVLSRGDHDLYRRRVDPLQASLAALCDGALGATFAGKTSVPISLDGPLCIDISGIGETDKKLTAAVLLACWGEGFAGIEAQQALADHGLAPRRNWFIVLDELWRVIRAGTGLVDRVDALTRLNRTKGVGMAMITHTLADLGAVDEADREKAAGFAERAGFTITAGLPKRELERLENIVPLSQRERDLVVGWSTPPTWNNQTGKKNDPPGLGKFLIKVGDRPGLAVQVQLTDLEKRLHNTNQRWGRGADLLDDDQRNEQLVAVSAADSHLNQAGWDT